MRKRAEPACWALKGFSSISETLWLTLTKRKIKDTEKRSAQFSRSMDANCPLKE